MSASIPPMAVSTLSAVSAFIDQNEGAGVSLDTYNAKAAIPYMAAFMAPLSATSAPVTPAAIEANVFLLAMLLESEAVSAAILKKKAGDMADSMFNLLHKYSDSEQIVTSAVKVLSVVVSTFEPNQHRTKTVQMKVLQALLVFSLDPREGIRTTAKMGVVNALGAFTGAATSTWVEITRGFFSRELGLDGSNVGAEALSSSIFLCELLEDVVDSGSLCLKDASMLFSLLVRFWALLGNKTQVENLHFSSGQLHAKQSPIFVALLKVGEAIFLRYSEEEEISLFVEVINALELPANASWEAKIARVNTICAACSTREDYQSLMHAASLVMETLIELTAASPESIPTDAVSQCFLNMDAIIGQNSVRIEDAMSWLNTLFGYRFRAFWAKSFILAKTMFLARSASDYQYCKPVVDHLIQVYSSSLTQETTLSSEVLSSLRIAIGAAISAFKSLPVVSKSVCANETSLIWLLDIVKDSIKGELLSGFMQLFNFVQFSPLVTSKSKVLRSIWNIFPRFCKSMVELDVTDEIFEDEVVSIVRVVASALNDVLNISNTPSIGRGLVSLFSCPTKFSMNSRGMIDQLLSLICEFILNLDCSHDSNWMLEAIKSISPVCSPEVIGSILKHTLKLLLEMESEDAADGKQHFEICNALAPQLGEAEVIWLYKTTRMHVQEGQAQLQKKAYKVLCSVLETHSMLLEKNGFNVLEDLGFVKSMEDSPSVVDPASKRSRLKCLSSLIQSEQKVSAEFEKALIVGTCGELILAVKEHGARTRQIGFELLGLICDRLYTNLGATGIEQLASVFVAGLAGSSRAQSGCLVCLRALLRRFKRDMSDVLLQQILQLVIVLSRSESREVAHSALLFIQTFSSSVRAEVVQGNLQPMTDALMFWAQNPKNRFKQEITVTFERLVRKYSHEAIRAAVVGSQTCTNTAIVDAIAKDLRRKQRKKESAAQHYRAKQALDQVSKRSGIQIKETEDRPLDLLDSGDKAWDQLFAGNDSDLGSGSDQEEFKFAEDGKMIIEGVESDDENSGGSDDGLEINSDDEKKTFTGRSMASMLTSRKRVAAATASTKTQKTTQTMRTMKSQKTIATQRTSTKLNDRKRKRGHDEEEDDNLISGAQFKAKKAGGDVRVAGQPEPYAFLGFHKKLLNKRLKHKSMKQYGSIVQAANRGAAAGLKAAAKARSKKRARTH
jgi:hypothetical protein